MYTVQSTRCQPRKVRILAPAFFQLCQLKLMIGNDLAIVTFKQRMSGFSETCFEPVLPQSSLFYSTVNCYRNILVGMGLNKPGMLATKYGQKKYQKLIVQYIPQIVSLITKYICFIFHC